MRTLAAMLGSTFETHSQLIIFISQESLSERDPSLCLLSISMEDLGVKVMLKLLKPSLVGVQKLLVAGLNDRQLVLDLSKIKLDSYLKLI
jgi:hypothetical protein